MKTIFEKILLSSNQSKNSYLMDLFSCDNPLSLLFGRFLLTKNCYIPYLNGICQTAIDSRDENHRYGYFTKYPLATPIMFFDYAFYWVKTEQRHTYWSNINEYWKKFACSNLTIRPNKRLLY